MNTDTRGLRLIEGFEGFSSRQYNDGTGVMTIGYGTTSADVVPLPRFLTHDQAEALLRRKLAQKYEPAVNALHAKLNQNQFDALVSFAYNLGPGSMQWDVGRYCRAGQFQRAADAMLQYDHAGGQRLAGLTRRRREERSLFMSPAAHPVFNPHYERYSTVPVHIGDRRIVEIQKVRDYDRLEQHPFRNGLALHGIRRDLAFLRDRIKYVAEVLDPGRGWTPDRKWRYDELRRRAPRKIRPAQR